MTFLEEKERISFLRQAKEVHLFSFFSDPWIQYP